MSEDKHSCFFQGQKAVRSPLGIITPSSLWEVSLTFSAVGKNRISYEGIHNGLTSMPSWKSNIFKRKNESNIFIMSSFIIVHMEGLKRSGAVNPQRWRWQSLSMPSSPGLWLEKHHLLEAHWTRRHGPYHLPVVSSFLSMTSGTEFIIKCLLSSLIYVLHLVN